MQTESYSKYFNFSFRAIKSSKQKIDKQTFMSFLSNIFVLWSHKLWFYGSICKWLFIFFPWFWCDLWAEKRKKTFINLKELAVDCVLNNNFNGWFLLYWNDSCQKYARVNGMKNFIFVNWDCPGQHRWIFFSDLNIIIVKMWKWKKKLRSNQQIVHFL